MRDAIYCFSLYYFLLHFYFSLSFCLSTIIVLNFSDNITYKYHITEYIKSVIITSFTIFLHYI